MATWLNDRAASLVESFDRHLDDWRVTARVLSNGARVYDFGIEAVGGISAGMALAKTCLAGLADVSLVPGHLGDAGWPHVQVTTDSPVAACLYSQYAGWQIRVEKFFAMGSGPMRAAAAVEELFDKLSYRESPTSAVGILETAQLPDESVAAAICEKTNTPPEKLLLLAAPTASQAGNFQVVARSVETALHKLFELGFDVNRVVSAYGTAPLSPVADNDLSGIGRTNDAILYGGQVTLYVTGDEKSITSIGPHVPSVSSDCYGKPFLDIFEEAGRDFYKIDPHLFSPAEVVFQNLETGRVHRYGHTAPEVLSRSFGL